MATDPRSKLPRRFVPFYDQAQTETAIRYGGQESALGSLLEQLSRDSSRESQAQAGAGSSLLGTYDRADEGLQKVYSDAGLTPSVLGQIANSPTGQRLAGELASGRAGIQAQRTGAEAGQQYIQQHIQDRYQDDFGKVADQVSALSREKGLYQSSLLDQLITGDRSARSAANTAARTQQHADEQAILDRGAAQSNALITQGLLPGADGTLQPLPGGKADPDAPGNQPKKVKATPQQQSAAASDFSRALGIASTYIGDDPKTKELRREIGQKLLNGEETIKGQPIYDTRPKIKGLPNPNYGKPLLNADGTAKTTGDLPGVPQINNQPIVQAALDMAFDGHLSPATVKKLHDLGYAVRGLSGVKTRADLPKTPSRPLRPRSNAPSGTRGQSRPT